MKTLAGLHTPHRFLQSGTRKQGLPARPVTRKSETFPVRKAQLNSSNASEDYERLRTVKRGKGRRNEEWKSGETRWERGYI
jgi:hypothetical protein